ncbi:Protein of unknown function [Cnuella takakiae]|uniref:YetF C-terminal domain-containing protein n=1 Tax=Cnuella takakiae TaxID=1302690 RepID=A0A1M5EPV6_9BACT|nr:YetF domain-containing protein [Cnuella takakiae]OLY91259.1 hypothetical protein BUE76_04590 [Cnuella takakiae]SHF81333.1 Protein of unknown function [Cnuella takakiae]
MKPEEIKLGDWMRMWMGEVPPLFLLEVVVRILIIFVLLIVSMRLLGLRMAAQLNRIEMLALFSLAAAIGVPLQVPDKGLLPAVIIAFVVVSVGKLLAWTAFNNQRFENLTEDNYAILVKDGVVQMKELRQTSLTIDRLNAKLRSLGVKQLGEVKRLYFEAKGSFSLVREQEPKPGLSVLPAFDDAFIKEQEAVGEQVCCTCGTSSKTAGERQEQCTNCKSDEWRPAVR